MMALQETEWFCDQCGEWHEERLIQHGFAIQSQSSKRRPAKSA